MTAAPTTWCVTCDVTYPAGREHACRGARIRMDARTVLVETPVPTPNARPHWGVYKRQRKAVRAALNLHLGNWRPRLPCTVLLVRIGSPRLDDDRNEQSMAIIRDEVARWIAGLPFQEPQTRGGKLVMRAPRAPDGPSSGIRFLCTAELCPADKRQPTPPPITGVQATMLMVGGRLKRRRRPKYEAVRITIQEDS